MPDLGEPEPPPAPQPLTKDEEAELAEWLRELRRCTSTAKDIEKYRKEVIYPAAMPLLKRAGSRTFIDPTNGKALVSSVREPQTLVVDLAKLTELVGAEIAMSVCKPAEVDSKEDGLFQKAVDDGTIPLEIVAEVAHYEPISPSIGFSKPTNPERAPGGP